MPRKSNVNICADLWLVEAQANQPVKWLYRPIVLGHNDYRPIIVARYWYIINLFADTSLPIKNEPPYHDWLLGFIHHPS